MDFTAAFYKKEVIRKAKIERDPVARILAVGAVVVGMVGVEMARENREDLVNLREESARLSGDQATMRNDALENVLGDCVNENIVRLMLDAKKKTLDQCIAERRGWHDLFDK